MEEIECDICGEKYPEDVMKVRPAKPNERGWSADGFEVGFGEGKVVVCPRCY